MARWVFKLPWENIGRGAEVVGAIGSVIVAVVALVISLHSQDMQKAITKLSDVARQTKRQADALSKQFGQVKREADAAQSQIQILSDQFGEMKQQTRAFEQSASAAQGQLSEMRDMQRAVVTVSNVAFGQGNIFGEKSWTVTVSLQNSGALPTADLAVYTETVPIRGTTLIQMGPDRNSGIPRYTPDPESLIAEKRRAPFRASLGPHVNMPVAHVSMSEQDLKRSVTDGIFQAVYGIAIYIDNARPKLKHETKFCFMLGLGGVSNMSVNGGKVSVGDILPTMSLCPSWNCTDSECKADKNRYEKAVAAEKRIRPRGH